MDLDLVAEFRKRSDAAKRAAHRALAKHEGAGSRAILLEDSVKSLDALPTEVKDYFNEALTCLQMGMLRAPVVFSWAGFFSVLSKHLYSKHKKDLINKRPKWKFSTLEDLKESFPEAQILDAAKEVGVFGKNDLKKYHGQLSERNQCAHPTPYKPNLNVAIGYLDQMICQTKQYI